MTSITSQKFESFVPVYDAIPEEWKDARPFAVEMFRKVSNGVNAREIGFYLEEELLTGGQFVPSTASQGEFRAIFRKVIDCGALVVGAKSVAHGINFDINFTLIDLWVSATNSTTFNAITMSDPQNVTMDATNINIISPGVFDRSFAFVEYILEA
jgi:hypothetical protein